MSETEILDAIADLDPEDRAYVFGQLWADFRDELGEARR